VSQPAATGTAALTGADRTRAPIPGPCSRADVRICRESVTTGGCDDRPAEVRAVSNWVGAAADVISTSERPGVFVDPSDACYAVAALTATCFDDRMGGHSGSASDEQRVPVTEVLRGLEIHPLEPGETALEAFVLIKVLDADGDTAWSYRTTNRLNREELLGALIVQTDLLRKELLDEWDDD